MKLPDPTLEDLRRLRATLSAECWGKRYREALARLAVVEALHQRCGEQKPGRADLRAVVPEEDRTNALRWWTRVQEGDGEPWERLFDRREVEPPWTAPAAWSDAVISIGSLVPAPSCDAIRAALTRRFGEEAALGDTKLREILVAAGLPLPGRVAPPKESVVELSGGGGLALLLAAARQTGAVRELAEVVSERARAQEPSASGARPEAGGRDTEGHFTSEYNRLRLEDLAERDLPFFRSVDETRPEKDLTLLRLRELHPSTLANHLLCLTALPLITEQRGTVGLNNPAGAWLSALHSTPYRAKTIEKTLEEMKWLGVSNDLWASHAKTWLAQSASWGEGSWREAVLYVDATNDPWWTRRFAKCGKVSRTGQVQPSLQRVVVSAGPGVPVLGVVASGRCELGETLQQLLTEVEKAAGPDSVRRITVTDAECCQLKLLQRFAEHPQRQIITVLKGALAQGKELQSPGEWIPFRKHDQLREGSVVLGAGKDSPELKLRAVEMQRPAGRRRRNTVFITTVPETELTITEVAEAYLGRWPYQEDLFRRGRNGAGLERSSGFGTRTVTHVALIGRQEKAARRLGRAALKRAELGDAADRAVLNLAAAQERLAARQEEGKAPDGRSGLGVRQAEQRLVHHRTALAEANRVQHKARTEYAELQATPSEIYVRDTEMESVATCFKMLLLALFEFISREYLGGYRLTPRTFIESWVSLPVTIRKTRHQFTYEVARNERDRVMTDLLEKAFQKITSQKLMLEGRKLILRLKKE